MASTKYIKFSMLGIFAVILAIWLATGTNSNAVGLAPSEDTVAAGLAVGQDDYVGSETCRGCHESQFDKVAKTKHGKLGGLDAWKGKVVGCESCHGPGREHIEGGGDKTKIKNFAAMNSKAVSESCLACHAGKESHNNFRRGEHWRNNVGCTDCHSAHGAEPPKARADSITFVGRASQQRPGQADKAMLKESEPSLCISCHSEMKAQFTKPFHHKVLEGTMTCSDCHNPHGGFEAKQTKLAVGADASCVRCHTNKQGPFVFEHAPLKLEGCATCHTPHGSANPKLLKRNSVRQLCIECHSNLSDQLAGDTPGFHRQTRDGGKYQNCTTCHIAIHGSNSHKAFFR